MQHQITTLPNGLRVVTQEIPGVESITVYLTVNVGSRYEEQTENGVAHLLEHMAFKGTPKRTARQIAEEFDMIGGQFNAYTSAEHTAYYAKTLAGDVRVAFDILSDIMLNSLFDAEELKREQGVVLQEIAAHLDTPDDLVFEIHDECAYPNQPLGRSILGPASQVESYTRGNLVTYMQKHYRPSQMVLSAAGKLKHEDIVALAETYCVFKEQGMHHTPQAAAYHGGEALTAKKLEQLNVVMGFPAYSLHAPEYYAWQLYTQMLGGGMSSRLFQEIREKRGLAYHVGASAQAYDDTGMLLVYSGTGEKESAELPLIIADEMKRIAEGVEEKELLRAKNQQRSELLMAKENSGAVASWLGKHLLRYKRVKTLEEIIAAVQAVSAEDIRKVAQHMLQGTPTYAALGPVKKMPGYDKVKARLAA